MREWLSDRRRPIPVRDIMLNRLHILADQVEVLKLIRAALPRVIQDVFGRLPLINLPPLELEGFSGSPPQNLRLLPRAVVLQPDHWRIQIEIVIK